MIVDRGVAVSGFAATLAILPRHTTAGAALRRLSAERRAEMIGYVLLGIIALSALSYVFGRRRAVASVGGREHELHSRPAYHGAFVAAWVGIPSILLVLIWLLLQGPVINTLLLWSLPPGTTDGLEQGQIDLLLSEIRSGRRRQHFRRTEPGRPGGRRALPALADDRPLGHGGCRVQRGAVRALHSPRAASAPKFRARHGAERILTGLMIACSLIAILTTLGILLVASVRGLAVLRACVAV